MNTLAVECLNCGSTRIARQNIFRRFDAPECPHCGYLGWAPLPDMTESERKVLRDNPLDLRTLRPVA